MILFELPEYLFNFRHTDRLFNTHTNPGDLVPQSFHGNTLNADKGTEHLLFSSWIWTLNVLIHLSKQVFLEGFFFILFFLSRINKYINAVIHKLVELNGDKYDFIQFKKGYKYTNTKSEFKKKMVQCENNSFLV